MRRVLTFGRLKWASFTHSAIYTVLLVVWLVPGLHGAEFAFGMAHGLGWIAMCLLSATALRHRVISLRLAVAVAVIGAVGPFVLLLASGELFRGVRQLGPCLFEQFAGSSQLCARGFLACRLLGQ